MAHSSTGIIEPRLKPEVFLPKKLGNGIETYPRRGVFKN
jgi:hypothetical protein